MPHINPELSSQPFAEASLRIHPAELGLGADVVDLEQFHRGAESLLATPGIELRTLIDEMPHGDNASTLVGKSDSGKSEIMQRASSILGVPHVDAGLLFRGLAVQAANTGYKGGELSPELANSLLHTVDEMGVVLGSPKEEVEQAVEINGVRYSYASMNDVDRNLITGISQDTRLYAATMDRLVQETNGKLVIVGGRSVNQHLPNAIAKFYIEREGNGGALEGGPVWTLDSSNSPGMITVVNPEGAVDDCARAVSLILARRVEARVGSDQKYPLSLRGVSLVTGEQAKVNEVEVALQNADQINGDEAAVNIAPDFLQEMTAVIEAKARNARAKFPQDQGLMVESTALYVPKLHEMGLPPEVIEYMSKHNHASIFRYAGGIDELDAYAVTVAALIDTSGNITTSQGVASGSLQAQGRGEQGFGWDAYFVPTGHGQTYGEMGSEKYTISSRAKAVAQLVKKLR
jgi:non-canonical purine NTP pyrophosphatase (RdgB/HAM1 family)